jgi:hypothetical protein
MRESSAFGIRNDWMQSEGMNMLQHVSRPLKEKDLAA